MPRITPDKETVSNEIQLAVIVERTKNIETRVVNIESNLQKDYVTQDQFDPIKRIVYGLVGVLLASFAVALASLVLRK